MKPKKRSRQIAEELSGVTTSEVMSEGRALQYGIQIVRARLQKITSQASPPSGLPSILEGHFCLDLTTHSQHGLGILESHAYSQVL